MSVVKLDTIYVDFRPTADWGFDQLARLAQLTLRKGVDVCQCNGGKYICMQDAQLNLEVHDTPEQLIRDIAAVLSMSARPATCTYELPSGLVGRLDSVPDERKPGWFKVVDTGGVVIEPSFERPVDREKA